jgi:hypothetical protein
MVSETRYFVVWMKKTRGIPCIIFLFLEQDFWEGKKAEYLHIPALSRSSVEWHTETAYIQTRLKSGRIRNILI